MTDNMLKEIQEATAKAKAQAAAKQAEAQAPQQAIAPAPAVVQHAPVPVAPESANWGAIEDIDADDLLVPKILHQQAISGFVRDGLSRPGDFCDSFTGEVLASKGSKLELIIFGSFKTMVISKFNQAKRDYVYDRTIPITKQNAFELSKKPYYEDIGGESYKNSKTYNFYCLIPSKVGDLPFVITLAGTKSKVAQKINTMIALLNQHNRPGAGVVFELKSIEEKNDDGAWFGLEVKQGRNTTAEELKIAHDWYLKSRTTKIVAADEHAHAGGNDDDAPPF